MDDIKLLKAENKKLKEVVRQLKGLIKLLENNRRVAWKKK